MILLNIRMDLPRQTQGLLMNEVPQLTQQTQVVTVVPYLEQVLYGRYSDDAKVDPEITVQVPTLPPCCTRANVAVAEPGDRHLCERGADQDANEKLKHINYMVVLREYQIN